MAAALYAAGAAMATRPGPGGAAVELGLFFGLRPRGAESMLIGTK